MHVYINLHIIATSGIGFLFFCNLHYFKNVQFMYVFFWGGGISH